MLICDCDEHIDQPNVYLKSVLLRGAQECRGQQEEQGGGTCHRPSHHLDAGCRAGLPCGRGISAGKGSPSAHTAPSTKYSFFQMGTVFFSVSISQREASKAAARCRDATTISTLVSPISNRPSRWTKATSRTWNWFIACVAISSIFFKAISSYAS